MSGYGKPDTRFMPSGNQKGPAIPICQTSLPDLRFSGLPLLPPVRIFLPIATHFTPQMIYFSACRRSPRDLNSDQDKYTAVGCWVRVASLRKRQ